MIVDWLAAWPSLLAAIAVIFLPGLGIGFFLRLRGLALWALAPAASIVVLSVLAIALGAVGIAWSPLSVGIGCVLVIASLYLARSVLIPVTLAVLLTIVLDPVVTFLQRLIGRAASIFLVVLVVFRPQGIFGDRREQVFDVR